MLDFDSIADRVVSDALGGMPRTASRNRYEWEVAAGLVSGTRVRLADGRSGKVTAPFPGCRGDGEWCGIFLDDGSEENVRPSHVVATFEKGAGWRPRGARTAADPDLGAGRRVKYIVEFDGHGTSHMSAKVVKEDEDGVETTNSSDHKMASELLASLVEFEANAAGPVPGGPQGPPPEGETPLLGP